MKKIAIDVTGMHCKSCELLLERSIQDMENVQKVRANQSDGTVEVSYDGTAPDEKAIETIILESGYRIGRETELPWFHTSLSKYMETILIMLALFAVYMAAKMSNLSFPGFGNLSSPTLGVAFLVGLTAGVSGCMALIGGIIL